MKKYFLIALGLFVVVGLGAWLARTLGFYNAYWFTDVILHVIAGAAFGFLWFGLDRNGERRKAMVILGAAAFAVAGSVVWELWEFAGSKFISPDSMRYYKPELGDSLGDLCAGFLGGLLAGVHRLRK